MLQKTAFETLRPNGKISTYYCKQDKVVRHYKIVVCECLDFEFTRHLNDCSDREYGDQNIKQLLVCIFWFT